ncbi:aldehyde dehydrogenase family protein [Actinomadura sp. LD22]|uniref:Aldehyde dehydrogenase family protein n=1 Tax=Actinomadura physcomitrii TaxID=2650748 RepID=A0A6I4MB68_9ACTN|nr:aldehyde dehydrogenase family protein [Actinomadura physcomitrii]MVZ99898.1 aldehyde dehydrogenase family protein [Actinomadura physcomitrii]
MKRSGSGENSLAGEAWVCSAVTGRSLGRVALAEAEDVFEALRHARSAARGWAGALGETRRSAAGRLVAEIDRRRVEIARLLAEEVGVPITPLVTSRSVERSDARRGAHGVSGRVVAWNDPMAGTADLILPALLAGQACVLVVAPEIALSGSVLADAVHAAGLPAGLVAVLPGGPAAAETLLAAGVDAGARWGEPERAAASVLLTPDVDLGPFLTALPGDSLAGNGQYPRDRARILVPRGRFAEIVEAVTEVSAALRVGDPRDPGVQIGPVIDDWNLEALEAAIACAWRAGARVTLGGARHRGWEDGCFLEPTVVAGADPLSPAVHPPVPGPLLALIPYEGEQRDAKRMARRAGLRIDAAWGANGLEALGGRGARGAEFGAGLAIETAVLAARSS